MPSPSIVTAQDGVTIAVHDFGGSGPDLLLAHATGFHGLVWGPVVEHLTTHFRCVAYDERGHGNSGRPVDGNFSWDGFALDALAVVDGLGLEAPFAAGHSCGGALLLLAELQRPRAFAALWCYEPIVFPAPPTPPNPDSHLAVGARRRRSSFSSIEEAIEVLSSKRFFANTDPAALRAYVEHGFASGSDGAVHLRCLPEDEAATFSMGGSHNAYARLGEVACPVTVATGALSDAISPPVAEILAAALPKGRVEVFDGLGHLGPLEDPKAIAESIIETLG